MLELKPILTKEEEKRRAALTASPYKQFWDSNSEDNIFKAIKAERKATNKSPLKFAADKAESYGDLVINKPKVDSPAYSVFSGAGSTITAPKEDSIDTSLKEITTKLGKNYIEQGFKPAVEDVKSFGSSFYNKGVKPSAAQAATAFGGMLDVTQKPVNKTIQGLSYANDIFTKYGARAIDKTVGTDIEKGITEGFTTDEGVRWSGQEEMQMKRKLFLGVQEGIMPNLNSFEENRRQIVSGLEGEDKQKAQQYLEDNKWAILGFEVVGGVATGVGSSKAITKLISKVPDTASPLVKRSLNVFESTLNPTLTNQAKFGATLGTLAALHYSATGEWIFKDDKAATEGALTSFLPLALKGMGAGYKATSEQVAKIMENEEIMGGLFDYVDRFARYSGTKASLLPEGDSIPTARIFTSKEKNDVYKVLQELEAQQMLKRPDKFGGELTELGIDPKTFKDGEGFTPKAENMAFLESMGALNKDGTFNFETINANFKDFQSSFKNLGKGFHAPKIKTETPVVKKEPVDKAKLDALTNYVPEEKQMGYMENKVRKAGLWDERKTDVANKVAYVRGALYGKYANTLGARASKILTKNKDSANMLESSLKGVSERGRISQVNKIMNDVVNKLGDDADEFAKWTWANNRLAKIRLNPNLKTSIGGVNYSADELQAWVDDINNGLKGITFGKYGEEIKKLNKQMLNYEVTAGIRSKEDADFLYKTNPYYVKDKLLEEQTEGFIRKGPAVPSTSVGKSLKEGSEDYDFNPLAFDNMYEDFARRTLMSARNEKKLLGYKAFKELGETDNIGFRIIPDNYKETGFTKRKGEVEDVMYINGVKKDVLMNQAWKDAIEDINVSSPGLFNKMIQLPSRAIKTLATGAFAPAHAVYQIIPEGINGMLYAQSQGIGGFTYLSNVLSRLSGGKIGKNNIISNPKLRESLMEIARISGADFSFQKAIKAELAEASGEIIPKLRKGKVGKVTEKLSSLGHSLEMNTLRLPLISTALKAEGIDIVKFEKWVKEADEIGMNIADYLKKQGVNVDKVGGVARDVFNYADASSQLRWISKYTPYLNISAVNTEVMRRLLLSNPKFAAGAIATGITASQLLYNHNYSGENGEQLRNQKNYLSHQSGLFLAGDDENEGYMFRMKNMPLLEWIYPLVVEFNEAALSKDPNKEREFSTSSAINKIVKDTSGFIDIEAGITASSFNIFPAGIKSGIESATNYNAYYDSPIVNQYAKDRTKGYELSQVDKNTKPYFKKGAIALSYIFTAGALALGKEGVSELKLNEEGVYEGGVQVSPQLLQHTFSWADPLQYRTAQSINRGVSVMRGEFEALMSGEELDGESSKKAATIFMKAYKLRTDEDNIYDFADETKDRVGLIVKDQIKSNIMSLPKEEVKEYIDSQKGIMDGKYDDYLKEQIANRKLVDKYGKQNFYVSKNGADTIAEYILSQKQKGLDVDNLTKALNNGLVTSRKLKAIKKRFAELVALEKANENK